MADQVTFGTVDIHGENDSRPAPVVDQNNIMVLDTEMVTVERAEEQVPETEPTQPVSSFKCASM